MKLDSNNHSVFLLYYHLVLVVKYRREVFTDEVSDFAKDMFIEIGKKYNITLIEWNHDKDHIHIFFNVYLRCPDLSSHTGLKYHLIAFRSTNRTRYIIHAPIFLFVALLSLRATPLHNRCTD